MKGLFQLLSAVTAAALVIAILPTAMPHFAQAAWGTDNIDCAVAADRLALGGGVTELAQADCEFLETIYADTVPANWTTSTAWGTRSDVETWYGIARSGTQVTDIELNSNNLVGDAGAWNPSGLTGLVNLTLSNNTLTGDIGSWNINTLTSLETLQINNNTFSGDVSGWNIGLLTSLKFFFINNNTLSGDIGGWNTNPPATLQKFLINTNAFTGDVTNWNFTPLTALKDFRIQANMLSGDISGWALAPITTMQRFFISSNAFVGDIPDLTGATPLIVGQAYESGFEASTTTLDTAFDAWLGNDYSLGQTIAPTNASSTSQTTTEVIVSIDSYEYDTTGDFDLLYGTVSGGPYTTGAVNVLRSAGTDITVPSLTANTVYYAVVEANTPVNTGGNVLGATSTEFLMILQTLPDVATASDDGSSSTDNITSVTTPAIEGSCVTGATVALYNNGTATGDSTVCAGGAFSITPGTALADGTHSLQTTQTVGGNESSLSEALSVIVDTTDPVPTVSVDTQAPNSVDAPVITYSAVDSNIDYYEFEYYADNGGAGVSGTPTISTTSAAGTFSPVLDADETSHTVIVRTYDLAGNVVTTTLTFPPPIVITAPTIISNTTIADTTFTVTSPASSTLENIASTLGTVNCNASVMEQGRSLHPLPVPLQELP